MFGHGEMIDGSEISTLGITGSLSHPWETIGMTRRMALCDLIRGHQSIMQINGSPRNPAPKSRVHETSIGKQTIETRG